MYVFPLAGGFGETRLTVGTWDFSRRVSHALDGLMTQNKRAENLDTRQPAESVQTGSRLIMCEGGSIRQRIRNCPVRGDAIVSTE